MDENLDFRKYKKSNCVSFLKTNEKFGGLSNMASGFPLIVNHIHILTSEALYQACRFPNSKNIQKIILEQQSPISAKMKSKHFKEVCRPDWNHVRIKIMKWCLRVKLVCNWEKFSSLLNSTGNLPIVEISYKSQFWGAKPQDDDLLVGGNVLGRLLMELRDEIKIYGIDYFSILRPPPINSFYLLGNPIAPISLKNISMEHKIPDKKIKVQKKNNYKQTSLLENSFLIQNTQELKKEIIIKTTENSTDIKIKDLDKYWFGTLPKDWQVFPNRALFFEIIDKNHPEEEMLSVTIKKGVIKQQDLLSDTSKKDSSNLDKTAYKLVQPRDIAYNKMRAWQGAIGVSNFRGIVSPAYIVVRPRRKINPRYFHYLMRTPLFTKEAERWSYGITSDQWSLRSEHFKMIYSPLPPLEEQNAIVCFLDYTDRRIKHYISAKQKLIKLLEEEKQAIIHQAVTRGCTHEVSLKSSRIEWLQEIPAHWEILSIKNLLSSIDYGISDSLKIDAKIPVLTMGNIQNGAITKVYSGGVSMVNQNLLLKKGDLLFNRTNSAELVAKVGLYYREDEEISFASYLVRLRTNQKAIPEFLNYLLNSQKFLSFARRLAIPSLHQSNLNARRYTNITIAVPPITEQLEIVKYLDNQLIPINNLIINNTKAISYIKEYRNRLIADVVTGKLDVRAVAAQLPEELEPEEIDIEEVEPEDDDELEEALEP